MASKTPIEWTDQTWNPTRGCTWKSAGCDNCYAEEVAGRFGGPGKPYEGLVGKTKGGRWRWNGKIRLVHKDLGAPLHWRKPRRVFVNSMSDLFHEDISDYFIAAVFGVMAASPRHTFQILTKRPERARVWFRWIAAHPHGSLRYCLRLAHDAVGDDPAGLGRHGNTWPLPNVWLGTSVEDQPSADQRIPQILRCAAAVHWVSAEPLLGPMALPGLPVHLSRVLGDPIALQWVVVGGESGRRARPMELEWARAIVRECQESGTAVFVKQLGAVPMHDLDPPHGARGLLRLRNRKGGDPAEWPEDLQIRQYPPNTGGPRG